MTATSPPSQSPFEPLKPQIRGERQGRQEELAQPVLALKKLVANLNREQNKIQNLLGSLSFALRSFNNLNQFLELTPLMVARVTDADGGVLIMVRGDGQLELGQLHSPSMVLARRVKQEIINNLNNLPSQPGINASELDRLDQGLRQSFGKNLQWFGTPILVNNQEQGRLYIFSQDLAYAWSQTRRRLAQLVADQTAVAIANHQMTVELRAKERQDRELEIASEIQLRLLPRQCPTIVGVDLAAHCRTANRVGGDYYDFIPTNYDQIRPPENTPDVETEQGVPWSIVIGDVMGKGVPAGLIMTMTRGMLRAEVLNRHRPAHILRHLNRVMYADLDNSSRFVTLFYSEYNPQTRELAFANAAHNPPMLWQATTQTIVPLDTDGMLMGFAREGDFEDARIQLSSGDALMYYTDGFTEAVNASGERFEVENLQQAFIRACQQDLKAQQTLDYLFAEVDRFVGADQSGNDDMTLVVMKVTT